MILLSSLSRCLAVSLVMVGALHREAISASQLPGLQVRISDREIADLGSPVSDINEPDVCVSRQHRICAAQQVPASPINLPGRFAVGTNQVSGWTAGELPGFAARDISIALADNTLNANRFVIVGIDSPMNGTIRYCIYSPESTPQIGPWIIAASSSIGSGNAVDKPWVIRRTQDDFFLFFYRTGGYRYLRTSDGTNWGAPGNPLPVYNVQNTTGANISGQFCCQPAVGADGKIWLAYATDEYGGTTAGKIRILVGTDPENDGTGPLVFAPLLKSDGSPAEVTPRHSQGVDWPAKSPVNFIVGKTVPYLACHPTDPSIAYVFYTDTAVDDVGDLDAYVGRFVRAPDEQAPSGFSWSTDVRVINEEHTSPAGERCDQFMPSGVVDSAGRVHVAYYSNGPSGFAGCDEGGVTGGQGGYTFKYDYWYSLSVDLGLSFTHYNLRADCDMARPLDLGLKFEADGTAPNFSPREYNGIDCYESGDFARIHLVYTGAVNDAGIPDDFDQRSLLFGQQVQVRPVQNP